MALPAFLRWDGDLGTEELRFDVVLSESAEFVSELTEHNVEKGSNISDHKNDKPDTVSLEVFCTNTPVPNNDDRLTLQTLDVEVQQYRAPLLDLNGGINALPTPGRLINAGIQGIKDAFAVPDTITTYQFSGPGALLAGPADVVRYKEQLDKLLSIKDGTTQVTVITAAHEYPNMLLLRIAPNKSPEQGDGYQFSLEFKAVRIVETALVDAPVIAKAKPVATPEVAKGAQNTKAGGNISLAKKGTNAAGITRAGSGRSSAVPGL
jgi:hypothetical protein